MTSASDTPRPAAGARLRALAADRTVPNVTAPLTDNALQVLRARYLARENGVVVETPEQLFRRVARHVSAVEAALGYTRRRGRAARARRSSE